MIHSLQLRQTAIVLQLWFAGCGVGAAQQAKPAADAATQAAPAAIEALAVSPDGRLLAIGAARDVRLWDFAAGKLLRTITIEEEQNGIGGLAFAPDGRLVAVGNAPRRRKSTGATVLLYAVETGELDESFRDDGRWAASLAFFPDGRTLAGVGRGRDPMLYVWRLGGGLDRSFVAHAAAAAVLAVSRDGRRMVTAGPEKGVRSSSRENVVKIWDVDRWPPRHVLAGLTGYPVGVGFADTDRVAVAADGDGRIIAWDVESGRKLFEIIAFDGRLEALAVAPDGGTLAVAGGHYAKGGADAATHVRTFGVAGAVAGGAPGPVVGTLGASPHNPIALVYTTDGRTLVTGGEDGEVHLWDARSGAATGKLAAPKQDRR